MVSRVSYRPFDEGDFDALAEVLRESWHADAATPEYGLAEAKNDLAYSLAISTFSQVALIDGEPRGIVLSGPAAAREHPGKRWADASEEFFAQMRELDPKAAESYARFVALANTKNNTLLEKSALAGSHEITLLAVSESARGMGIGSVLIDAATSHLASHGYSAAHLFTDTDCTWQFYEHCGFKRAGAYRSAWDERRTLPREMYLYGIELG